MSLADELKNDPLGLGYAAHLPGDPQRAVDLLTTQAYSMAKPITAARALAWAGAGPLATITDKANEAGHPARASCLAFLRATSAGLELDPGDSGVKAMFDGWVTLGVISQADHDALFAFAAKPVSRAEVLGIPAPTARDILEALEQ